MDASDEHSPPVAAHQARALVVLAHTGLSADASDATAVRTVLALKGLDPPVKGHVVIELMDVDNRSIVELIGDPLVETVVSHDIIGRLMVRNEKRVAYLFPVVSSPNFHLIIMGG